MIERVVIGDGKLWTHGIEIIGSTTIEYPIQYPLVASDGSRPGEYRGDAVREVRDGRVYLRLGTVTDIYEFEILDPTQEARDYANGWIHAHMQKRRVAPKGKSDSFASGWYDGWRERNR